MKATVRIANCVFALSIAILAAQGGTAHAQGGSGPVFQDYLDGADGHFLHRSALLAFAEPNHGPAWRSARYAVCNFDPKDGLIFAWDKPGFSTGWRHPLMVGSCLTMSLDGDGFAPDGDAPILFSQSNKIKKASAYLPVGKDTGRARTEIEAPYDRNGAASTVAFSITTSIQPDGLVHGFVRWSQGTPSVAVAFDLPPEVLDEIAGRLAAQGVKVQPGKPGELKEDRDPGSLTDRAREARTLEFTSPDRLAFSGEFSYRPIRNEPVSLPILLLDDQHGLLARASYRSIR